MSVTVNASPFDLCGPLPDGVTVLQASAGTGKTYAIAALATRYVADGWPLDQLLVVTFTRAATSELRERVRTRLAGAEEHLGRVLRGDRPDSGNDVLALLASGSHEQLSARRERLARAVTDFDAATIDTIHGFCQKALRGLGLDADLERDLTFADDLRDLIDQVVDDIYVSRFAEVDEPPMSHSAARRIGRESVMQVFATIAAQPPGAESTAVARVHFAEEVRDEVGRRMRRGGLIGYDDLLSRLRTTLEDPVTGAAACGRLRERYRIALIDEFQDTDPVQWGIFRRIFTEGNRTLVLIGDPKQAIYAFRGADVYAYLDAVDAADAQRELSTNWRSDQALVDAHAAVFEGTHLGDPQIVYLPVAATPAHTAPGIQGAPSPAALRVRVLGRDDPDLPTNKQGHIGVDAVRAHIAQDLAADLTRLLSSEAQLVARDGDEARAVQPGDMAVLVQRHKDASAVREALIAAGVPAVVNGPGSVFATDAAREWLRLLAALERPGSRARVASAALTSFLGWSARQVADADESEWEQVHERLHRWADLLRTAGVASLLEAILVEAKVPGRVLANLGGERTLTDIRHLAQLLHRAAAEQDMGVATLTAWLGQRIADAADEAEIEERTRRLESDDDAVQVLTVHRAKGLEYPIVYCPYLFVPGWIPPKNDAVPVFHERRERIIDVAGPDGHEFAEHRGMDEEETRGEELRLAYVALTRARHQVVTYWAPTRDACKSPLGRLLFARDADGSVGLKAPKTPPDDEVFARLRALAESAPKGCIAIERTSHDPPVPWKKGVAPSEPLKVARLERSVDMRWRRTSYSAITERAHEEMVASEPERAGAAEPEEPATTVEPLGDEPDEPRLRDAELPLADATGGTELGHLVHRILEHADFAADDLEAEIDAQLAEQIPRGAPEPLDRDALAYGLARAIETPLGPSVHELRLRDVARGNRINELEFELPLLGGDSPEGELTVAGIGALLERRLPDGDPVREYAKRLGDAALSTRLRGYLIGYIDLVVRQRGTNGDRYLVIDHKTNRLAPRDERPTAWHFRPEGLERAMRNQDYPLQALIYVAALHRYLRWRLPGYRPQEHLGGVLYLFTRGLAGPDVPRVGGQPIGVWSWQPPPELVEELSDLLDRGVEA